MARRTTKVEGFKEIFDRLKQLPAEVAGKNGGPVLRGLRKGGQYIADVARNNVRNDGQEPDRLKKSIKVTRMRNAKKYVRNGEGVMIAPKIGRLSLKKFNAAVKDRRRAGQGPGAGATVHADGSVELFSAILRDDEAPYAGVQEFGAPSQGIPAQGFMRRAADSSLSQGVDITRFEIGKAVDAAFRKLARQAKKRG